MNALYRAYRSEIAMILVATILGAIGISRPSQPVQVMIGAGPKPVVQTTVYSATWCGPCTEYTKAIRAQMPKDGWIVRDATDKDVDQADIAIDKDDETSVKKFSLEKLPTTIIRKHGLEVKRIEGAITPDELSEAINKINKENP